MYPNFTQIGVFLDTSRIGLDLNNPAASKNESFRLCSDNTYPYYHNLACAESSKTKFYRSITFDEVSPNTTDQTHATFTVKVQWRSLDGVRTLSRTTTIYNK